MYGKFCNMEGCLNLVTFFTYLLCAAAAACMTLFSLAAGICAGIVSARLYNNMPPGWFCEVGESVNGIHTPGMRRQAASFFPLPGRTSGREKRPAPAKDNRYSAYEASFFCAVSVSFLVLYTVCAKQPVAAELSASVICLTALAAAAQSDMIFLIIPDQISCFIAVAGLLCAYAGENAVTGSADLSFLSPAISHLAGGAAGFLTMLAAALLSCFSLKREGIGMGDIKLIGACGIFLGTGTVFPLIFLSSLFCCIPAIFHIVAGRAKNAEALPMAPSICFAFTACLILQASV